MKIIVLTNSYVKNYITFLFFQRKNKCVFVLLLFFLDNLIIIIIIMKNCSMSKHNNSNKVSLNLNIQMYSFQEILNLFEITNANNITIDDLKRAKALVLKTHPDKSRLPTDYFLFYKKALEIVVEFYNNQQRTTREIPKTEIKYSNEIDNVSTGTGNNITNSFTNNVEIGGKINSIQPAKFQKIFNELFEKNQMGKQVHNKNEWFSKEENEDNKKYHINSVSALNSSFDKMKEKKQQDGVVVYKEVKEMPYITGAKLYEDIEDEDDETNNNSYIETDPFSKLKFEDIKKVHKNETIFIVGEKDYDKVDKYSSVEEYSAARNISNLSLKTKEENERILKEKEEEFKKKILMKEYQSKKKEIEMENKNKSIMSYFLQLM